MKWDYRVGRCETRTGFLSHSIQKLVWFSVGGFIGILGGLYVVMVEIRASVQPLVVTQDSRNGLPIVHALQQNGGLYVVSSVSSADDLQTAGGYNVIQRTERVQP